MATAKERCGSIPRSCTTDILYRLERSRNLFYKNLKFCHFRYSTGTGPRLEHKRHSTALLLNNKLNGGKIGEAGGLECGNYFANGTFIF